MTGIGEDKQRDREGERKGESERERVKDRQTDREREKERETEEETKGEKNSERGRDCLSGIEEDKPIYFKRESKIERERGQKFSEKERK